MSSISIWILSIIGVVMIGVLVEIILPEGKTNTLLKSVVAVASIFIIISPLKNIDFKSINFSNMFSSIEIDSSFVEDQRKNMIETLQTQIENDLTDSGYLNVSVQLQVDKESEYLEFNNIFVDLRNLVLSSENLNINKYTNIVAIVRQVINVDKDSVIFYEWRKRKE